MFAQKTNGLRSFLVNRLACNREKIASLCISRVQAFSENTSSGLDDRYSTEERNIILQKLNSCTTDELKKYRITDTRLKKIMGYRAKNGSFKTVEEFLVLQGMDIAAMDRFCKSIIKNASLTKSKVITMRGEPVNPVLDERIRSALKTYLGISIWGRSISWAQINADMNLLHWNTHSFDMEQGGLIPVIEAIASTVLKIPQSDIYIMEAEPIVPFSRLNGSSYLLHLHKQQITSVIVSILGMREKRLDEGKDNCNSLINNIYMMRHRTPARLFKLLIGTEIVSAKNVVDEMINDRKKSEEGFPNIYVSQEIKEHYKRHDIYEREQMNWALLITAAFLDLSILKISEVKVINNKQQSKKT